MKNASTEIEMRLICRVGGLDIDRLTKFSGMYRRRRRRRLLDCWLRHIFDVRL